MVMILFDIWQVNAVKFFNFKPSTAEKVNKMASRFWFAGILFSITHGLLKVAIAYLLPSNVTPSHPMLFRPGD